MRRNTRITIILVFALTVSASYAYAQEFRVRLNGFEEVGGIGAGQTGAILSNGTGTGRVRVNAQAEMATYTLTYSGLGSPVTQAHIHFGKKGVDGGIMVFFCSNLGNGPAGTPACPAAGGTVTGTWTAASIIGPTAQGVSAGNFDALVAALDSNTAYANIHTAQFPAGEIRGQLIERDDQQGEDN
jgi:hypothetical protein